MQLGELTGNMNGLMEIESEDSDRLRVLEESLWRPETEVCQIGRWNKLLRAACLTVSHPA